ncbi:MAG TPA: hypothetical protein VK826_15515 [Bacteroidia bacterium]|nr:hypothetical protein [Bacteroidia bacterium]
MKKIIIPVACAALFISGCSKEGIDGDAILVVKPAHHSVPIVSTAAYRDSVFVKFNVKDVPADPTHDYDLLVVGEVGEDHIHVEGLKWGDYSVYCAGWDTAGNQRVIGGVHVKIKRKERKNEIVLDVPVTE